MDSKVFKNVKIGKGSVIELGCIIGIPPQGKQDGELQTIIGENAYLRSGTYIYAGNIIGENFVTGNKVNIRENNKIGNNVSIGTLSIIEHHVEIEDGVRIHSQVFIPEYTILKSKCWIGPNAVLTNAKFPLSLGVKARLEGPIIHEEAIIGANSTLLPGVEIKKGAIVGAGSVVTKTVEEKMVVAGNAAKPIRSRDEIGFYQK